MDSVWPCWQAEPRPIGASARGDGLPLHRWREARLPGQKRSRRRRQKQAALVRKAGVLEATLRERLRLVAGERDAKLRELATQYAKKQKELGDELARKRRKVWLEYEERLETIRGAEQLRKARAAEEL